MSDQEHQKELEDHKSAPSDNGDEEEDVVYLDDEEIEAMDKDDDKEGDFQTVNESEIGADDAHAYQDG